VSTAAAPPRCSIVIPAYNHASLTRQCLNALFAQPPEASTEIIVVDDGSSDRTQQVLAEYRHAIRVVTHATNLGFAAACNDGAAIARGEYLVFLNNDTLPEAGWLDELVRYADAHPRAAVVGSKLLYPNDTVQHAGIVVCQDRFTRSLYCGFPADHPAANKSRRVRAVTAACMLVRRAAFAQAGGFDTAFTNAYEDHDLCLRLGELGHEVHYCHRSVLHHLEGVSRAGRSADFARATSLFRLRWSQRLVPDDLTYYAQDGLLRVTYQDSYPARIQVEPLLAAVDLAGPPGEIDRLLESRSRQVFALQNEVTRLTAQLTELSQRLETGSGHGNGRAATSSAGEQAGGGVFDPPAELVRLIGGEFHEAGNEYLPYFTRLAGLRPTDAVLEVGCGVGRMAVALTRFLSAAGRYDGFDIMAPAIKWCQAEITARFPNFTFKHADVYNKFYNPDSNVKAIDYRFPYPDDSFDFVFLTSVFTHISRVLKASGRCVSTFFLLNEESLGLMRSGFSEAFDFKPFARHCRAIIPEVPEAAIAYDEAYIRDRLAAHNLVVTEPIRYGRWCGRLDGLSLQDIVVVTHGAVSA
jgi:GT2 family glycosyltransferase/SAM-dependent methyltransferase